MADNRAKRSATGGGLDQVALEIADGCPGMEEIERTHDKGD